MMPKTRSLRAYALMLLPALGAGVAVACSSSSSDPGTTNPGTDAGGSDSTASDSSTADTSTPMDAAPATDGACAAYTGPIPADAGALCHDLVNSAPRIPVTQDLGAMPVGTDKGGETLGDGLYYITEFRAYPGAPANLAGLTVKYTVLIAGGISYTTQDNSNETTTVRKTTMRNPDGGAGIELCSTKPNDTGNPETSKTTTCDTLKTYDANFKFGITAKKQ